MKNSRAGELIDAYLMCQLNTPDVAAMDAYEKRMVTLWDADPARIVDFLNDTCADGSGAEAAALVATLPAGVFNSVIIRFAPETSQGMNLMLNEKLRCTEQFPFAPTSETVIALLRARGLPEFFVEETEQKLAALRDGCLGWRDVLTVPAPATFGDYPVLILSGDFDSITPPALAQLAADQIPQATLVLVPNATHSILGNYGECPTALVQRFMATPSAAVDASCTAQMRVPWILPDDALPGSWQ
ncbi:MAG: alpha/beta hydrolase [Anaerolineales bacterium]|nr:alpha/beta hydrolase [Anaerolineales bacterium]